MSAPFTIVVPAHNEASVIRATLARWAGAIDPAQVVVVCNGCRDATAAEAREGLPGVGIIETATPGKANAINLGLAAAAPGAVLIVDADVSISPASLRALTAALSEPGTHAVSPAALFDLTGADELVRGYYATFRHHPYLADGVGGAGVYGLSAEGRRRIGSFPAVLSDDDYVRHFFTAVEQRRVVTDTDGTMVAATVSPPRRWNELVRTEARWRAGDGAVRELGSGIAAHRRPDRLAKIWRAGGVPLHAIAAYLFIKLLGRARRSIQRMRRRSHVWHRDNSSRTTPADTPFRRAMMPPEPFPTPLDIAGSVLLALTVALAFATAVIVARRGAGARLVWFWRGVAMFFLVMALYRAIGAEHLATDRLRQVATGEGWYDERQGGQALLTAFGVLVLTAAAVWIGVRWRAPWQLRLTMLATVGYAVLSGLRLVSLHIVDSLLYRSLGPIHANWLFELALVGVIWLCAIATILRPRPPTSLQPPTGHRGERRRRRTVPPR